MWKIGIKIDENRIDGDLEKLNKDLKFFQRLNIESVEIPVHSVDAVRFGNINNDVLKQLRKILKDFNFEYTVHCPSFLNIMDEDANIHMAALRASLEFTVDIGAKVFVYHPGRFIPEEKFFMNLKYPKKTERDKLMDIEREFIQKVADEFKEVTICMENARPYLGNSPYCYAEKISELKSQVLNINRDNVRINLDLGHLYLSSNFYKFDPVEELIKIFDSPLSHS